MAFVLVVDLKIKKECAAQFMVECLTNAKAARERRVFRRAAT